MDAFDKIFKKSDLDENKKKGKMIFGRLLINLRSSNHIKLYSLLGGVKEVDINDNMLEILIPDNTSYEMINNRNDMDIIDEILDKINCGIKVKFKCDGKKELDIYKFEEFLQKEFGKKLIIKK